MTKQPFKTFVTVISLLAAALFSFNESSAQTVQLLGDKNHSNVSFSVPLGGGITRITGKFTDFDITLNYVDTNITKSNITAVIKAASITTGVPARDEHLNTHDFFATDTFPVITFTSDSILKTSAGYMALGTFQFHGVSKKIELPFTITGKDAEGSIGFAARYTIKRSIYGIGKDAAKITADSYLPDDINVEIDFITKKKKDKK